MTQYRRNPKHDMQMFAAATITDMLQNGQQDHVTQIITLLANGNTDNNYYVMRSRLGHDSAKLRMTDINERFVHLEEKVKYTVFQKKPVPTPLDIPWHIVAPEWTCAAMDKDKKVWFYTMSPSEPAGEDCWRFIEGKLCYCPLAICTDGIDWENSLTFRPEGHYVLHQSPARDSGAFCRLYVSRGALLFVYCTVSRP